MYMELIHCVTEPNSTYSAVHSIDKAYKRNQKGSLNQDGSRDGI